jgi:hypothetical protein
MHLFIETVLFILLECSGRRKFSRIVFVIFINDAALVIIYFLHAAAILLSFLCVTHLYGWFFVEQGE